MAAASALMLTACSSESDVLQNTTQSQQTAVVEQAVGFDVYTPAATNVTRSGQVGTMTTDRLQRTEANGGGFGVYAYLVADTDPAAEATSYKPSRTTPIAPNFMVNEKVLWNPTNQGWYYNPLKYWPNETNNDSQNTNASMESITGNKHLDRLTFFAYAPYVALELTNNTEPGIGLLTQNDGKLQDGSDNVIEASVGYRASLDDPEKVVDLLWGVAPAGGLSYTAVNGTTVKVNEGEPLIDMTKPDVNTTMKFLFNHALARIGINVVAAVDQVGAGGDLNTEKTRITIDNVTLTGKFGETGVLNLDNPKANVANWANINTTTNDNVITSSTKEIEGSTTLTLSADAGTIARGLRYVGEHTFGSFSAQNEGVTTTKQDLITPRYYALDNVPAYSPSKQYYTEANAKYTVTAGDAYYTEADGNYTKVTASTVIYDNGIGYYTVTDESHSTSEAACPTGAESKMFYTKDGDNYTKYKIGSEIVWDSGSSTYYLLTVKSAVSDIPFVDNNKAVATYTVTGSEGYYTYNSVSDVYTPQAAVSINAPEIGSTNTGLFTLLATGVDKSTGSCPSGYEDTMWYTYNEGTKVYTKEGKGNVITWSGEGKYYRINATAVPSTEIPFAYADGTYYDKERNYFMVIPTNNVALNTGLSTAQDEALRKVRVKIEYYVTTVDSKVEGGYTQTKNVIEKDVLFPSMANGKSYMLNLVLGLTSVKMEAEVDDWKVINVQGDLPQNTSN